MYQSGQKWAEEQFQRLFTFTDEDAGGPKVCKNTSNNSNTISVTLKVYKNPALQ